MEPTLRSGQRLLARRFRGVSRVRHGDILLVNSAEIGRVIVKRVVGLPGENISVERDGRVWVDGEELVESHVVHASGPAGTYVVPADRLFLLGDNRTGSSDSRTWPEPYVSASAVLGKAIWFRS